MKTLKRNFYLTFAIVFAILGFHSCDGMIFQISGPDVETTFTIPQTLPVIPHTTGGQLMLIIESSVIDGSEIKKIVENNGNTIAEIQEVKFTNITLSLPDEPASMTYVGINRLVAKYKLSGQTEWTEIGSIEPVSTEKVLSYNEFVISGELANTIAESSVSVSLWADYNDNVVCVVPGTVLTLRAKTTITLKSSTPAL